MATVRMLALYAFFGTLILASTTSAEYYRLLKQDVRRCARPYCGGFFLEKVNVVKSTVYVAGIDYSIANKTVQNIVTNFTAVVGYGLVVFFGRTVPLRGTFVSNLLVTTAFIGLPKQAPVTSALTLYNVVYSKGGTTLLRKLNAPAMRAVPVPESSVQPVRPVGLLDLPWQRNEILSNGALMLGKLRTTRNGTSLAINLSGVFIKIPVERGWGGVCPIYEPLPCKKGGYYVNKRLLTLCFLPVCAYVRNICPRILPLCPEGYRRVGWVGLPGGCIVYTCDPIFMPVATMLKGK